MTLLGEVESVFSISGRGTVVVPTLVDDFLLHVGDQLQIRSSDGRIMDGHITGVEFTQHPGKRCRLALLLSKNITRDDISAGAELWKINS